MSKLYKVIHNATTGEIETLELTEEELAQKETDRAELLAAEQAQAAKAVEKAALLVKLGITEDEARLLLG
jgi:hypothetical protein